MSINLFMSNLRLISSRWKPALWVAVPVSLFILGLFYLFTPTEYRYISTASNFFAFDPAVQFMVFAVTAALAVGITRLRQRLQHPIRSEVIQQ